MHLEQENCGTTSTMQHVLLSQTKEIIIVNPTTPAGKKSNCYQYEDIQTPAALKLLALCIGESSGHRIIEQFVLEGTYKGLPVQSPYKEQGRDRCWIEVWL